MAIKSQLEKEPYHRFSTYLKNYFGTRVQKVTLDAGFTCPNRDGKLSTKGCIFCNNQGFSSNTRTSPKSLEEQLKEGIQYYKNRFKVEKFIAYFQAYTNTYAPVDELKKRYDVIRNFEEVVGISIGTRPDCVTPEILDLIQSYTNRYMVWIEYGLQSVHNEILERVNRHHTYEDFLQAVEMTQGRSVNICAHVILGLPGETKQDMLKTAQEVAKLPINGLKLHILHVMKNTPLATYYENGGISLLTFDEYVETVCDFLERIPYDFVIQRLTADAPPALLIGPHWCTRKTEILAAIKKEFEVRKSYQGKLLGAPVTARN